MEAWLNLILGGGLVATIGAIFKGAQMWRNSTTARTNKAIERMERWQEEADKRTRRAQEEADRRVAAVRDDMEWYVDLADYWRDRAGRAEYQARAGGVTLEPPPPLPVRQAPTPPAPTVPLETTTT